jgi:ribosomal protein L23
MNLKPVTTEKAVKLLDGENTLVFKTGLKTSRDQIKREIEKLFNVKVHTVRTLIRNNIKTAYVKLDKKNPAVDVAAKLGMI